MSEAEYLSRQAAIAKAAISATLSDIKMRLGQTADVRSVTREHPWITLGSALIAGFTTASALVPSKEEQALKKLAAIENALRPPAPAAAEHKVNGNGDRPSPTGGLLTSLIHEVIGMIRPTLISLLTAGLAGRPDADSTPQSAPAEPGASPHSGESSQPVI